MPWTIQTRRTSRASWSRRPQPAEPRAFRHVICIRKSQATGHPSGHEPDAPDGGLTGDIRLPEWGEGPPIIRRAFSIVLAARAAKHSRHERRREPADL